MAAKDRFSSSNSLRVASSAVLSSAASLASRAPASTPLAFSRAKAAFRLEISRSYAAAAAVSAFASAPSIARSCFKTSSFSSVLTRSHSSDLRSSVPSASLRSWMAAWSLTVASRAAFSAFTKASAETPPAASESDSSARFSAASLCAVSVASLRSRSTTRSELVPASAAVLALARRSAVRSSSCAVHRALSSSARCVSRPSRLYASDSVSRARTSSDSFVRSRRSYSCVILARTLSRTLGPPGADGARGAEYEPARSVTDPRVRVVAADAAANGLPPLELPRIPSSAPPRVENPGKPPVSFEAGTRSLSLDASCSRFMPYWNKDAPVWLGSLAASSDLTRLEVATATGGLRPVAVPSRGDGMSPPRLSFSTLPRDASGGLAAAACGARGSPKGFPDEAKVFAVVAANGFPESLF